MKKYICEEMMCDHCVSRIDKALSDAGIEHEIVLADKTVAVGGGDEAVVQAVEILDDLGFSAQEC